MAGLNLSGLQTLIRCCYIEPRILGDFCSLHSDSCLKVDDTDRMQEHRGIDTQI